MSDEPIASGTRSDVTRALRDPSTPRESGTFDIEQAYLAHAAVMRRVATQKFRIPCEDAETLVHDVFVNCIVSTKTVHADLRSYLIGAICNVSRNYWRTRDLDAQIFDSRVGDDTVAEVVSDENLFAKTERTLTIAAVLSQLGSRCREVLKRYYLDDEDANTIATVVETSKSNVNYMMYVCRRRARLIYEKLARVF